MQNVRNEEGYNEFERFLLDEHSLFFKIQSLLHGNNNSSQNEFKDNKLDNNAQNNGINNTSCVSELCETALNDVNLKTNNENQKLEICVEQKDDNKERESTNDDSKEKTSSDDIDDSPKQIPNTKSMRQKPRILAAFEQAPIEQAKINEIIGTLLKISNVTFKKKHIEVNPEMDGQLVSVCEAFGCNKVMDIHDARSRQTMIAFCHPKYENMCYHLGELDTNDFKKLLYDFISKEMGYINCKRDMFDGIYKLQEIRWLNDGQAASLMANHRSFTDGTETDITDSSEDDNDDGHSDDDDDDDGHEDCDNISHETISPDDKRYIADSKHIQCYILAFLCAAIPYLMKAQFDNKNASLMLDLEFPDQLSDFYETDTVSIEKLIDLFESSLNEKAVERSVCEHFLATWSVDMKLDYLEQELKASIHYPDQDNIGVEIKTGDFVLNFDPIQLFHVVRAKRHCKSKRKSKLKRQTRLSVLVHKFGDVIKFYLVFGDGMVLRLMIQDIVQWLPHMFYYNEDPLQWDDIRTLLSERSCKWLTSKKLQKIDTNKSIWPYMKGWSDLDPEFYMLCMAFTKINFSYLGKKNKDFKEAFNRVMMIK